MERRGEGKDENREKCLRGMRAKGDHAVRALLIGTRRAHRSFTAARGVRNGREEQRNRIERLLSHGIVDGTRNPV